MDSIVGDDLQASDDLLFNVFTNIVKHPKLFPSKDALADFSDDVKAAKRLGGRKRIRPKTMRIWRASRATFYGLHYSFGPLHELVPREELLHRLPSARSVRPALRPRLQVAGRVLAQELRYCPKRLRWGPVASGDLTRDTPCLWV